MESCKTYFTSYQYLLFLGIDNTGCELTVAFRSASVDFVILIVVVVVVAVVAAAVPVTEGGGVLLVFRSRPSPLPTPTLLLLPRAAVG